MIDEGQKIPDIGLILKLMTDELSDLKIIVTGSSSFDISNITGEPLTGRKYTMTLYPLSEREFSQTDTPISRHETGSGKDLYMEIILNYCTFLMRQARGIISMNLSAPICSEIYLFMKTSDIHQKFSICLGLLLFRPEVWYHCQRLELSYISKNTVEKYLDLLSKVFILYKLEGFSRNLRKEITKNAKWYFFDNGIRNAVIADFKMLGNRNDTGQLWENYIISERLKYRPIQP